MPRVPRPVRRGGGFGGEVSGPLAGRGDTGHRGVGELAALGVLAHPLAHGGLGAFGIEQVIGNLKRHAERPAKSGQRVELRVVGPDRESAEVEGGQEQGARFAAVDPVHPGHLLSRCRRRPVEPATLGGEVVDLTTHERRRPRCLGQSETGPGSDRGGHFLGEHLKRQRLQRIAAENGGGLVERAVAGGASSAEIVVVHGREIVVDERVGVDALDGDSGWGRRFPVVSNRSPR